MLCFFCMLVRRYIISLRYHLRRQLFASWVVFNGQLVCPVLLVSLKCWLTRYVVLSCPEKPEKTFIWIITLHAWWSLARRVRSKQIFIAQKDLLIKTSSDDARIHLLKISSSQKPFAISFEFWKRSGSSLS